MTSRLEQLAGRILKVRERKLVILFASLIALVIGVGTAWEKSQPFVRLFLKASSDAEEIAKIRKDVEQQRDTIGVIARDANTAHAEMDKAVKLSADAKKKSEEAATKASEIAGLAKKASAQAEKIKTTLDFSFVLARAAADDRHAFDELSRDVNDEGSPFHDLALKAIVRIAGDLSSRLNFEMDWKRIGINPDAATLAEFEEVLANRPAFDKPGIISKIWQQQRFSKFDRLSFLYDVIKSTDSILVLNAACSAMNDEAKINKNIIGYSEYLSWWWEHGREYAGLKEYKPSEHLDLPADSIMAAPQSPTSSPSPTPQ
jgi:hypothetical protein